MKYKEIIDRLVPYSEQEVEISVYQGRDVLEVRFFAEDTNLIFGIRQIINEKLETAGTELIEGIKR